MSTLTVRSEVLPASHPIAPAAVSWLLPGWFCLTLFVSAMLLFLVQPMLARMVLPLLGGTPGVWNTCMVFYQAALLVGYAYAHVLGRRPGIRAQLAVHGCVLLLPLFALPIAVGSHWIPPGDQTPIPWLLALLSVSVGVPFIVVSTSAPLLQLWFSRTGHPSSRDPYFLYAASNLGSMLALVGYPLLFEPLLRLQVQSWIWTIGYYVLFVLILGCGLLVWRSRPTSAVDLVHDPAGSAQDGPPIRWQARLRWLGLALIPSSLMLGVTTHLTTDVAAVPLLWILPLALYLLTFILVFSNQGPAWYAISSKLMPVSVLVLVGIMITGYRLGLFFDVAVNLLVFFVIALTCHGELARLRPGPRHLTEFFLVMSIGGVLGGVFNALIAPTVFDSVIEFPLALVAACLLMPAAAAGRGTATRPTADAPVAPSALAADRMTPPRWPRTVLLVGALAAWTGGFIWLESSVDKNALASQVGYWIVWWGLFLGYGLPLVVCFRSAGRPGRFAACVAGLLLVSFLCRDLKNPVHTRQRSFFGQMTVTPDPSGAHYTWLLHGTTLHGMQSIDPERRGEPLSYFHRSGPAGQVFAAFSGPRAPKTLV